MTADPRAASGKTGSGGILKILDMGLARVTEGDSQSDDTALTQAGTVVGTPDYMSPEQGKNSSSVDPRSDLYALGCTLYFLLSGQPPFSKGTTLEKLLQHQIEPPPSIHGVRGPELSPVPPAVEAILMKLLAKRPDDRFQSGLELAQALEPCCVLDSGIHVSVPAAIQRITTARTEVSGSPFNFDDADEPTQPVKVKAPPAKRTDRHPEVEPFSEERELPKQSRKAWWIAGLGILAAGIIVAVILILQNRKSKPDSPTSAAAPTASNKEEPKHGKTDLTPKVDPPEGKKDIEPLEAILTFLPHDTAFVAVFNLAQMQQSPLFREELLPRLDPNRDLEQLRPLLKFDALSAVERITLAVPLANRGNPPGLLIVQGNGFLTPELIEFLKFHEKKESVSGTTIAYYESSPKPGEAVTYATKLSHNPTTVALSHTKQLVLNAYLRTLEKTPPAKKDHLDPYLRNSWDTTDLRKPFSLLWDTRAGFPTPTWKKS